jgi:hypothetical protein
MKFGWSMLITVLLLQLPELSAWGDSKDIYSENQQVKMDELADACARQAKPDEICVIIVNARQIGNDAVEAVKAFLNLTPEEYALLTAANALAQGRIRIRTGVPFLRGVSATFDLQRDETRVLFETSF